MPTALGDALARVPLLLLLVLPFLALVAAAPAAAQTLPGMPAAAPPPEEASDAAEPAAASPEQIRGLIEALEDPARREELITSLRALLEAQAAAEPEAPSAAEGALAWFTEEATRRIGTVEEAALSIVESLDQVPHLLTWTSEQLTIPTRRAYWLDVAVEVGLILGLGAAAYVATLLALRRKRRRFRADRPERAGARAARLVGWFAAEVLPPLVFAAVAYTALTLLDPPFRTRLALGPLINAGIIAGVLVAAARVVLAPGAPGLRPLPLADESAAYGFRWARRIIATAVYGGFVLKAGLRLGLPWTIHGFLLHLLYLAVAAMVATTVLQRRERVAAGIARLGEGERRVGLRRLPWEGFARIWHLLALLYVAAAYLIWALRIPGGFQFLLAATLGSAAILLATWAALRAIGRLTRRGGAEGAAVAEEEEGEEPEAALAPPGGAEERASRYLPLIGALGRALVAVVAALALLQVWGVDVLGWFGTEAGRAFGRGLVAVAIVAAVTFALWEVSSLFLQRAMAATDAAGNLVYSGRTRTLLTITRSALLVFLGLIAILLILSELGLNIAPLLAGAGVIGIAIGFGSQKLVQDVITGMFVLLGDTIRVGDVVQVAGKGGLVEAVSMRTVRLRGYDGLVHTIPYSAIDTVTNMTKDFSFYVFDVGVAYREDVDQVMRVLREIGAEMQRDRLFRRLMLEPIEVAGVDRFADSAVIIRARIKTLPLKQWDVGREFNRRMKIRFDELGIEIPFPHRTLYFGVDRQGEAPPARLRMETDARATEPEPAPVVPESAPAPSADAAAAAAATGTGAEPEVVGLERRDAPSPGRREATARPAEDRRRPGRRSTADRG